MKFQLAINLERVDDSMDMRDVARHTLEMVQMAERAGFTTVWAAEHHALEMTIAPNPFQILTWWAGHTDNIRLGTAVAVAAYWHPINLAGEAALLDLISGGRLEFGIGSGAYQREFDRMHAGLKQSDAYRYMHEMLPALKALWAGDYEHNGEFWSFPTSTSVPKPLQQPHPPIFQPFASSEGTIRWCAREGITAVIPTMHPGHQRRLIDAYNDEAKQAGRDLEEGEGVGLLRDVIVAETDDEAFELWAREAGFAHEMWFAPFGFGEGLIPPGGGEPVRPREMFELGMALVGSVDTVTRQLEAMLAHDQVQWLFAWQFNGLIPHETLMRSLELFATKVLPNFENR
jgi:alkanesulfonate monooxygenase SsuD/methylene tetrahydromethanopterin reductase-like flavin-dependent oxidoreductase (luciferase family)